MTLKDALPIPGIVTVAFLFQVLWLFSFPFVNWVRCKIFSSSCSDVHKIMRAISKGLYLLSQFSKEPWAALVWLDSRTLADLSWHSSLTFLWLCMLIHSLVQTLWHDSIAIEAINNCRYNRSNNTWLLFWCSCDNNQYTEDLTQLGYQIKRLLRIQQTKSEHICCKRFPTHPIRTIPANIRKIALGGVPLPSSFVLT